MSPALRADAMQRTQVSDTYGKAAARFADVDRRQALIRQYAPLVKFIAERLAMRVPRNISVDDLISAGILGLMDAIDKFDPGRAVQFKTYAGFRIRGAMLDELRDMDWVPRSVRKKVQEIERAILTAERRLGRPAEDVDIAREMGVDLETYHQTLARARGIELVSLDEPLQVPGKPGESPGTHSGLLEGGPNPMEHMEAADLKESVAKAIRTLTKKEQQVLSLYYFEDLTLKEVGSVMGLTESRICQIHTQCLLKLRARLLKYKEG